MLGDSGQKDAEIYRDLVEEYPNRILGIYIRDVSSDPQRQQKLEAIATDVQQAGSQLEVVADSLTAANHAVKQGWIKQAALASIQSDLEKNLT